MIENIILGFLIGTSAYMLMYARYAAKQLPWYTTQKEFMLSMRNGGK